MRPSKEVGRIDRASGIVGPCVDTCERIIDWPVVSARKSRNTHWPGARVENYRKSGSGLATEADGISGPGVATGRSNHGPNVATATSNGGRA